MQIRKEFLILYSAAAAVLGFSGCASGENDGPLGTGRVDLTLEADISVEQSVESRATTPYMPVLSTLTADKLNITLTNKSGSYSSTWPSRAEFPADKEFPADTYTMTASFGNTAAEGFESPQLYGESTFQVVGGKISPVKITAKVANSLVMLEPTEKFVNYFQSVKLVLNSAAGNSLVVNPGETRPVYVNPGTARIDARVVMPSGKDALITIGSFTAKKGVLHRITLDVEATTGTALLTVTFDDTLADAKPIEIELSDALFTEPAPVVTPEGFTGGRAIDIVETYVDEDYAFNIATRAGLVSAKLSIIDGESAPDVYDLLNQRDLAVIEGMGLRLINVEEGAEFSKVLLKDLLAKIRCNDRENVASKKITLSVMDRLGRTTEEQLADNNTLAVNLTPIRISVHAVNDVVVNPTYQVVTNYNGRDIDKVKFYVKNNNNQKAIVYPKEVTRGSSDNEYIVTFNTPVKTYNFNIMGYVDDEINGMDEINVPEFTVNCLDKDRWARSATVEIGAKYEKYKDIIAENIVISPLNNEGKISRREDDKYVFNITNLEPGKEYKFNLSLNGLNLTPQTITTEQALQLPNSNMENWYETDVYTKTTWSVGTTGMTDIKCLYPNESGSSIWATRNPLTTGQTSGVTCYYTSYSGTLPITWNNSRAAQISTLGYGEGTTYSHTSSGKVGSPKKKISGMLFVGDYKIDDNGNEVISYGKPFESRPSSFTFKYKYVPVNSESFRAYIVLENRNNGIIEIGRGEYISSVETTYKEQTIDIVYSRKDLVATHIYVVFESSTSDDPTVLTVQGSKNAFNGYSDSKYVGSELTVDDIKLNY